MTAKAPKKNPRVRVRGVGAHYLQPGSPNRMIEYWRDGKRYRESCGSPLESVAVDLLTKRRKEYKDHGRVVGPTFERTRYEDAEAALLRYFDREGKYVAKEARKSLECRLKHLRRHFGHMRALLIRFKTVDDYDKKRKAEGAAPATIKTEVSFLRLALVRAVAEDLLAVVPLFPRLEGSPPRKGSATPEEMARLIVQLPPYLRGLVALQYATGWRGAHLRALTWKDNVLDGPVLFLPRVKGNKKRWDDAKFDCSEGGLAKVVEQQRLHVAALTLKLGRTGEAIPWVFPNAHGEPITGNAYKLAWARARKAAKLPHLRPHDCRRSAVQNDRRLDIEKPVRMAMVGHSDEAVHDDYDAASAPELKEAAVKIANFLAPGTLGRHRDRHSAEAVMRGGLVTRWNVWSWCPESNRGPLHYE